MSNLKASGRIHLVKDTKQITETFCKRELILEMDAETKYPQLVPFEFTGDRCDLLDSVGVGNDAEIEFTLNGREWTSPQGEVRHFGSLRAWAIHTERVEGAATATTDDEVPF